MRPHQFPPCVRHRLDALISDQSDPLQPLAVRLGKPKDAAAAKRWSEIEALHRVELDEVGGDVVRPFLELVRDAQMIASGTQDALRKIAQGLRQAIAALPDIERAGLAPTVRCNVDAVRHAAAAIRRTRQPERPVRTIKVPTFSASCQPSEGADQRRWNEIPWRELAPMMLAASEWALPHSAIDAKHGDSETSVRFIRALHKRLHDRYGRGNTWTLIAWVCTALQYRPSPEGHYTPDRIREICIS